jgi:hypothetical protein
MSDVYEIIEKLSREVCELHSDNQRLRARVEVLERAMRGIAEYCDEGDRRTFLAVANTARAALEATP